jgi:hypothetical protein
MSAIWNDGRDGTYYVRIMAKLPPAEPAAAWIRESLDIARGGVVKVEDWSVVLSHSGAATPCKRRSTTFLFKSNFILLGPWGHVTVCDRVRIGNPGTSSHLLPFSLRSLISKAVGGWRGVGRKVVSGARCLTYKPASSQ